MRIRVALIAVTMTAACASDKEASTDLSVTDGPIDAVAVGVDGSPDMLASDMTPDSLLGDAGTSDVALADGTVADLAAPDATAIEPVCEPLICGPGTRLCGSSCVSDDDPDYNCGVGSCSSSCDLPNAQASCSDGTCVVLTCTPPFANCDGDPANGCEADLTTPQTCTDCNTTCAEDQLCVSSSGCASTCPTGFTLCSGGRCVDLVSSATDCGYCGKNCWLSERSPDPAYEWSCVQGTCSASCAPGYTDCGENAKCRDLNSDTAHCGECGNACASGATCVEGECVCPAGWTLCGDSCVLTQVDRWNCGACGTISSGYCPTDQICVDSVCQPFSSIWVASDLGDPEDLVVDGDEIFWTDIGDGSVRKMNRSGGPITLLAQDQGRPMRIAVDTTHVYWTNNLGAAVMRVARTGLGDPPQAVAPANRPLGIALDATNVYWADTGSGHLMVVAKAGGTATEFAEWEAKTRIEYPPMFPGNPPIYVPRSPDEVSSDGTALFASAITGYDPYDPMSDSDRVVRIDLSSKEYLIFNEVGKSFVVGPSHIFIEGDYWPYRYSWYDKATGALVGQVGTSEQGRRLLAATTCGLLHGAWADGSQTIQLLVRLSRNAALAHNVFAHRLVVDGEYIYWTDKEANAIGKLPLPH